MPGDVFNGTVSVPIFCFDQKDRSAASNKLLCSFDYIFLMTFDINFNEPDVVEAEIIEAMCWHLNACTVIYRQGILLFNRPQTCINCTVGCRYD